jgi:hypothetical protein
VFAGGQLVASHDYFWTRRARVLTSQASRTLSISLLRDDDVSFGWPLEIGKFQIAEAHPQRKLTRNNAGSDGANSVGVAIPCAVYAIPRAKRHSGHGDRLRIDKQIGANMNMLRSSLVFGLLMTSCASASAATVNYSRTHHYVIARHSQGAISRFPILSAVNAAAQPTIRGGNEDGSFGAGSNGGGRRKYRSGYSVYPYDPDCDDFFFRHPDYPTPPGCN